MDIKQLRRKLAKMESKLKRHQSKLEHKAAKEAAEIIQERTRRGFGVDKHMGPKTKLKPLSSDYVKQRKREGLTSKSRLTRTGQLLDSIKVFRNKVIIDGRRSKEVARYVAAAGRAFFNLSSAEYKRVSTSLKEDVKKILGLS